MENRFNLPKLSDAEVSQALATIASDMADYLPLSVSLSIPYVGEINVPTSTSQIADNSVLHFLLNERSSVASSFALRTSGGQLVVTIKRSSELFDNFILENDWRSHLNNDQQSNLWMIVIKLISSGKKHLKAHEVDASWSSDPTSAWSKYRNAQVAVLSSLEKTAEQVIVDVANKNAEIDRQRAERFEKLESQLRSELASEREKMQEHHESKMAELGERIKGQELRESAFETKEARYVARKKQEEQLEQVKNWLNDWKLTHGTTQKRRPIFWSYLLALVMTGGLTVYATLHNYELLKSAADLAQLQWWNWLALTSKAFFPLAAFTTFMVYFIKWSSAWARQHSDEEFINRSRLIDIGRSSWLLEAVRDAQERNNEIPPELLKELSRNLFSHTVSTNSDDLPHAAADVLLQGLTSLRVKSPGGTEVEAKRGK